MHAQRNAPERKYALTKVGPGDYLLPSNDHCIVWRIARYEDGPASGLDLPRNQSFWGVWRWHQDVSMGGHVDTGSWDRWELWSGLHASRAAAIDDAMRMGERG